MKGWSVRLAALLTGVTGIINVLSAVTPSIHGRVAVIRDFLPLAVRHGSHLAAALAGFALLLLAANLWRRKHTAWLLTLAALCVSAASHVMKGLDLEEAGVALATALVLVRLRPHFHARSDPPSIRRALWMLVGAFAFTLVYGVTGFYLLDRHFSVNFSLVAAIRQTIAMFTQFDNPGLVPVTRFGQWFGDSIYFVSAGTTAYALLLLVRPVLLRSAATPAERARARAIVEAHGRSSLARVTLLDDKAYFFSPGGSVVAFVVRARTAIALGDPIGPPEDAAASIAAFVAHSRRNDWMPAFYQTLPDLLPHFRAAGLDILCIGQEAIVDLASFTLEGHEGRALRGAVNRLEKSGHRAVLHFPPLSDPLLEALREVSDEWLTLTRGMEKRFSLGWFDDDYVRGCPVMTVTTAEGRIVAFANLMPEYQLNESTVDLMRHRRGAPNGTMDYLFCELFRWARAQGYATFNLGLCALAGVGGSRDDPAVERAMRFIYEHVDHFYSFKGVHEYKEKFRPAWSPRYLAYPGPASLPSVVVALILADSGTSVLWRRPRLSRSATPAGGGAPTPLPAGAG
jgi:phosphatidylglycerol lysyltransferase